MPLSQTMSVNNNENRSRIVDVNFLNLLRVWLDDLSKALYDRFRQLGGIEYLEESITYWRQSLNLCPITHPNRSDFLNNFATAMTTRFEQSGRMDDIEEAITCHRQVLTVRPDPNRSSSLDNLANAVSTRGKQLGKMEDLEEAITCLRQALVLRLHGHPDRSFSLNNLAIAALAEDC